MQTKRPIVFCDIEPAGPHRRAPIIEVAAIAVESGSYRELDSFDAKVQFDVNDPYVDVDALGVSKFSPTTWEQYALSPHIAARNFTAFLNRYAVRLPRPKGATPIRVAKLAAHNADFDNTRLRSWCRRHLKKTKGKRPFYPGSYLALCTVQKADWFFQDNQGITPPENLKLATLADYFQLKHRPDHKAINDVRATIELARTIAEFQRTGVVANAA